MQLQRCHLIFAHHQILDYNYVNCIVLPNLHPRCVTQLINCWLKWLIQCGKHALLAALWPLVLPNYSTYTCITYWCETFQVCELNLDTGLHKWKVLRQLSPKKFVDTKLSHNWTITSCLPFSIYWKQNMM